MDTLKALAGMGRNGDTELAHVTPGEVVVPNNMQSPQVMRALQAEFGRAGVPLDRYTVGGGGQRNQQSGLMAFAAPMMPGGMESGGENADAADDTAEIVGRYQQLGPNERQALRAALTPDVLSILVFLLGPEFQGLADRFAASSA